MGYRSLSRMVLACLMATIAIGSFVRTSYTQSHSTPQIYNVVFLIDSSNSMTGGGSSGINNDPEDKRVRFARFLVRYMQTFHSNSTRVGVIRFYGRVTSEDELVPLSWVDDWSLADLKSINESDEMGLANTNFRVGLERAGSYFVDQSNNPLPCSNGVDGEKCYILLFSDGEFETQNFNKEAVARLLEDFREHKHIQVIPILFGDNPESAWWEEHAGVVINGDRDRQTVYEQIFRQLELVVPSERFNESVIFTNTITLPSITATYFHKTISISVIADDLFFDNWLPTPTLNSGTERIWLEPTKGKVMGELLLSQEAQPGSALAYYTLSEIFYPLDITTMAMPENVHINQPVHLSAQLSVGGKPFTETEGFAIQAQLDPGGVLVPLLSHPNGRFIGSVTPSIPGTYTVTFIPTLPTIWENIIANTTKQYFLVDDIFHLTSLESLILPEKSPVGEVVEIKGRFLYDGVPLTVTSEIGMKVVLESEGIELVLMPQSDGWFTQHITPTAIGTYTIRFIPDVPYANMRVINHAPEIQFYAGDIPDLHLNVGAQVKTNSGFNLPVALTIDNYSTIQGIYTPTLEYIINGVTISTTLQKGYDNLFTALIPLSNSTELSLSAWIPAGMTLQGVRFPRTSVYYVTNMPPSTTVAIIRQGIPIFLLIVMAILLIGVLLWLAAPPKYVLVIELQNALSFKKSKDEIKDILASGSTFTKEWWDLLEETSQLIIKTSYSSNSSGSNNA